MPIAINGSGTVTGVSTVGGLPDGIVIQYDCCLADNSSQKPGAGAVLQVVSTTKTDTCFLQVQLLIQTLQECLFQSITTYISNSE